MAIYLNPNNENFKEITGMAIYVDKTMMIPTIEDGRVKHGKYLCVSRPRRFGKTIAGNMLAAYYSKGADSRALFQPFKVAGWAGFEQNLNKFNVIKIDVNGEYRTALKPEDLIIRLTENIREEFIKEFKAITFTANDSIANCIQKVYDQMGEQFVIIMDEYDVLVREKISEDLFREYLDLLNGLFKNDTLRPAIHFAYLTGILPIVRDRVQSKLNNFREFTVLDAGPLAEFIGFTESEVKALCEEHNVSFAECKRWYDGYQQRGLEIYNPESVVRSMEEGIFDDYWGKTSTYAVISDRIKANFVGMKDDVIKMLSGENVPVNVTRYMNTMTDFSTRGDAFTYLIHVGYLAYNREDKTCRIPNKEVRQEWFNAIEANDDYAVTNHIIESSRDLLAETLAGNAEAVARALDESHIHVTSNRSYNNEDALQSAIYLSYIYALNKYTIIKEMTTGKGFADVVFIPFVAGLPAMIIELKRNSSSETALSQIKEKKYFASLNNYRGKLLFIGVNYDEKSKTHECRMEEFSLD